MNDQTDVRDVGAANLGFARALDRRIAGGRHCDRIRLPRVAFGAAGAGHRRTSAPAAQRARRRAQRGLPGARVRQGVRAARRAALHIRHGRCEFPARRRGGRAVARAADRPDRRSAAGTARVGRATDDGAEDAVRGIRALERGGAVSVGARRRDLLCTRARAAGRDRGDRVQAWAGALEPAVPRTVAAGDHRCAGDCRARTAVRIPGGRRPHRPVPGRLACG